MRELLKIDNARIIFRNFSGVASNFNREGDRNFCVVIEDQVVAQQLIEDGWNIKTRLPRDGDDYPFYYLPVKVKFGDHRPNIYLSSGKALVKLNEGNVSCLDDIDIRTINMDISPYNWDVNGKQGKTAYLYAMKVTQEIDRFRLEMENNSRFDEEDVPFI